MRIVTSGKNIELTDAIKTQVGRKLGKLEKFFPESTEMHVTVSVEKNRQIVEVTIPFNSVIIRAEIADTDLYAAIDKSVDVIERQIRKNKTRLEKRLHHGALDKENYMIREEVTEEKEYNIVRNKKIIVKPMTTEEAILQMNLLGHEFFLYQDADQKKISVVYRRRDGNYGVIEPEA
ncbi:MAG TPA: ribosome-associated translation inhibitor RaiA [Clostridiales bacterium]|nr:ribosome-associated translation inhibitor RaiA [Clostridiales bacterium]